jgi:cysteine desulfurase
MEPIYLDNAATTKLDVSAFKAMKPYFIEKYGNASSQHSLGMESKEAIEKARKIIAGSINASDEEIIFTSGGTEANNLALKGLWFANKIPEKNIIITTKIEHDSILKVCKWLEGLGAKIVYLDVDKEGFVNLEQLKQNINDNTLAVSIIQGNNEIGTLQNIEEIGNICKTNKVLLHIDACQSYTKIPIDVKKQDISLMTINGHKLHGPKGIGALYVQKGIRLEPLLHGGGHERGMRSGTEDVAGIVGFGEAVRISNLKNVKKIEKLRDYTIKEILKIKNTRLNGPMGEERLANNINISFSNIEGEAIQRKLQEYGIMISTGSACASNSLKKSHVLRAIGLNDLEINSSIRVSLSKFKKKQEIDYFTKRLKIVVEELREISPFA